MGLFLVSCQGEQYPSSLRVVDSLIDVNPDSALTILKHLHGEMAVAPESTHRYYQLLRIKALDRLDQMQVSPDSIKEIVRYYEEDGDESMLPMAYYYAGRVYSDLNEAPISLIYFQKALKTMDERAINDQHLKSVIYSQMGYLYLFQYIYDEAERCFQTSYNIGVAINDTSSIFWGLIDLGSTFQWQNKFKESLALYKKAEKIATDFNDIKLIVNANLSMASLLKSMNDYPAAKQYMYKPMLHINLLDSTNVYSIMAEIYDKLGEVDSMSLLFKRLDTVGNIYAKEYVYKRELEIELDKRKDAEVQKKYIKFIQYHDSVNSMDKSTELQRINSLYTLNEFERNVSKLEKQRMIHIGLLCVLLFITLALLTYLYSLRRRTLERFKRFRLLHREINQNKKMLAEAGRKLALQKVENITSSDTYQLIKKCLTSNSALNSNQWIEVEALVCKFYPGFKSQLYDLYEFSIQQYRLCLLVKLGVSPSSIAILTAHTISSISHDRKRLYKKCFGEEGTAEQWDEFIRSL